MTDLDVREIAERLISEVDKWGKHARIQYEDAVFLLNAYVRETRIRLQAEYALHPCEHHSMAVCRHVWTEDQWHIEALRDLNLKDVWT